MFGCTIYKFGDVCDFNLTPNEYDNNIYNKK